MKKRKYTDHQIATAKAAKMCGIKVKVIARKLHINMDYLLSGAPTWEAVEYDPTFVDRFNALFGQTEQLP